MRHNGGISAVLRRWPSIVLVTLLALGLTVVALSLAPARYTAQADVLVSPPVKLSSTGVSARAVASYAHVVGSREIAADVADAVGLAGAGTLRGDLTGRVVGGTAIIRVEATRDGADQAAEISQAGAEAFVAWLTRQENGLSAQVVEPARAPGAASSPARAPWLWTGGVVGLLLGLLLAASRATTDRTIRTPAELEDVSGAPVLGAIAFDRTAVQTPLITSLSTHHPRFEAIRILRTNLQFLDIDRDHRVITVTSAVAGEGKSTTATNLAIALAQTGTQVALIEGDLRRPRVAEYLGIEKTVGVTTVLVGRVALDAALQPAGTPGLDVLTSGSLPPNPSEIIQTEAMKSLVAELRQRYEVVLIDAPPLLPVTDASLLASISDGAILVVRHGETGGDAVRSAAQRLQSVGARLLGTVLSMAPVKELSKHGYGYGYGYGPEYFQRTAGSRPRGGARKS